MNDLQRGALACKFEAPRFGYIAPQLKQAKDAAWDMLKRIAQPLKSAGAKFNEAELRVDYPNGGRVRIYGADNPDAIRGVYFDGVVMDEYAQQDPVVWTEVVRPMLADRNGWATFIGTPKGRDAFWRVWRNALQNRDEWFTLMLKASETGVLPKAELRSIYDDMDDHAAYMREMECSFDEPGAQQFISTELVQAAVGRNAHPTGPKLLGVDIARAGADSNVILFRDGNLVPEDGITRFKSADLMQTVGLIAEAIERRRPDATFVDGAGVGGGVVDRLRQLNFNIIEINAGSKPMQGDRFKNLRAEMYWKMRDALKDRLSIPHNEQLIDDLTAPSYKYDLANRLQLEGKEDMKARGVPSPDVSDALAMTYAQPVYPARMMGHLTASRQYAPEYDPFSGM